MTPIWIHIEWSYFHLKSGSQTRYLVFNVGMELIYRFMLIAWQFIGAALGFEKLTPEICDSIYSFCG
jgi:hypothetical protein